MKRIVCAALLGVAAFAAPASAAEYGVEPIVWNDENRVGVGARYKVNGGGYDPVGAVYYNKNTGEVCAGLSYQIPLCVGSQISIDDPLD
jgi:hypothetical protein